MLLSIISVIPGADITPGGLWHQGLPAATAELYTMMWHPSKTDKPKPPHSPTIEPQKTLDVYHNAVIVAMLKNT